MASAALRNSGARRPAVGPRVLGGRQRGLAHATAGSEGSGARGGGEPAAGNAGPPSRAACWSPPRSGQRRGRSSPAPPASRSPQRREASRRRCRGLERQGSIGEAGSGEAEPGAGYSIHRAEITRKPTAPAWKPSRSLRHPSDSR